MASLATAAATAGTLGRRKPTGVVGGLAADDGAPCVTPPIGGLLADNGVRGGCCVQLARGAEKEELETVDLMVF